MPSKRICARGTETKGFEWLGQNGIYSSQRCYPPEEHWMRCGTGRAEHECTWTERAGIMLKDGVTTLLEETTEIIGEGFNIVGGWIAGFLHQLWPYLLLMIGLILSAAILYVLTKGGLKAAMRPCGRKPPRQDRKLLLQEGEEQTAL